MFGRCGAGELLRVGMVWMALSYGSEVGVVWVGGGSHAASGWLGWGRWSRGALLPRLSMPRDLLPCGVGSSTYVRGEMYR